MGNFLKSPTRTKSKIIEPKHADSFICDTILIKKQSQKEKKKKLKSKCWLQHKFGTYLGSAPYYKLIQSKWMQSNELLMIVKIPQKSTITIWKVTVDVIHKTTKDKLKISYDVFATFDAVKRSEDFCMDVFESSNTNIYIMAGSKDYLSRIYQISSPNRFQQICKLNRSFYRSLQSIYKKIKFLSDQYVAISTTKIVYIFQWQKVKNNKRSFRILDEIQLLKSFEFKDDIESVDFQYVNKDKLIVIIVGFISNTITLYETIINENGYKISLNELQQIQTFKHYNYTHYSWRYQRNIKVLFSNSNNYSYPECVSYCLDGQCRIYELNKILDDDIINYKQQERYDKYDDRDSDSDSDSDDRNLSISSSNIKKGKYVCCFKYGFEHNSLSMIFLGYHSLLIANKGEIHSISCLINDEYFAQTIQDGIRKCLHIEWDLSFIVKYILLYLSIDWIYYKDDIKSNLFKTDLQYFSCINSCSMRAFLGRNVFILSNCDGKFEIFVPKSGIVQ